MIDLKIVDEFRHIITPGEEVIWAERPAFILQSPYTFVVILMGVFLIIAVSLQLYFVDGFSFLLLLNPVAIVPIALAWMWVLFKWVQRITRPYSDRYLVSETALYLRR